MLRNYLATAFRSFKKQKGFTVLNILGLSLAMAASSTIVLLIAFLSVSSQLLGAR